MGYAMLKGWLAALPSLTVVVVEPDPALRKRAQDAGAKGCTSPQELPAELSPDLIFLAVKPQAMASVVPAYKAFAGGQVSFVSIAAGVSIKTMEDHLPGATPLIRCMPNTPASIGKGMMVCCCNAHVSDEVVEFSSGLLASSGKVLWIESEELMDAVTAVSGSGPAYLFHFIECLTEAGTATGLPQAVAEKLAMQTVYGAVSLARDASDSPATLRQQVTSPGGTTAAALAVLMNEERMTTLVSEAVEAAKARSIELGAN